MNWFELYIITRLDAVVTIATIFGIVGLLGVAVCSIVYFITLSDYNSETWAKEREIHIRTYRPLLRRATILVAILCAIALFVPTTKDVAIIHGLHWLTNNEDMKQMPDDVARKLRLWLNDDDTKEDTP